jgi:hypothetical protein
MSILFGCKKEIYISISIRSPSFILSACAGAIGQIAADMPSGLSLTPLKETNINIQYFMETISLNTYDRVGGVFKKKSLQLL